MSFSVTKVASHSDEQSRQVPPRKFHVIARPPAQAAAPRPVNIDLEEVRNLNSRPRQAQPANLREPKLKKSQEELDGETIKFILDKNKTFKNGSVLLNSLTNHKSFKNAYEVSLHLYDLPISDETHEKLLKAFGKLAAKGQDVIGKEFYAWIRCVLTRALQDKVPNPTLEEQQQIISGYTESADLGSYVARYNLAMFYSATLDNQQEALNHLIKYTEEHPTKSFGFKELAVFYLVVSPSEVDKAIAALRKGLEVVETDPTCAYVPAELALILAQTLENTASTQEARQEVLHLYTQAKDDVKAEAMTRSKAAFNLGVIHQKGWIATDNNVKKYSQEHCALDTALALFRESKEHSRTIDDPDHNTSIDVAIAETLLMDASKLTQAQNDEAVRLLQAANTLDAELLYAQLLAEGNPFVEKDVQTAINSLSRLGKKAQEKDPVVQLQSLVTLGALCGNQELALASKSMLDANSLLHTLDAVEDRQAYIEQVDNKLKSYFDALIEENRSLKEQLEAKDKELASIKAASLQPVVVVEEELSPVTASWLNEVAVLTKAPQDNETRIQLALAQLESKQYEEVKKTCFTYLEEGGDNTNWQVWFILAKAALEVRNYPEALKLIQHSLDCDHTRDESIELKKEIEKANAPSATPRPAIFRKGIKLYKEKKTADALQTFIDAKNDESCAHLRNEIFHYMAMCYMRGANYNAATYNIDMAIEEAKRLGNKDQLTNHFLLAAELQIAKRNVEKVKKLISNLKEHNADPVKVADIETKLAALIKKLGEK